jgi:hypothetical protein
MHDGKNRRVLTTQNWWGAASKALPPPAYIGRRVHGSMWAATAQWAGGCKPGLYRSHGNPPAAIRRESDQGEWIASALKLMAFLVGIGQGMASSDDQSTQ